MNHAIGAVRVLAARTPRPPRQEDQRVNILNKRVLQLGVSAGLALGAWAVQAAPAVPGEAFRWSCERRGAPRVAEIRNHFGIANAGQAYQWRGIVHRYLQRECRVAARMALEKARQAERPAETGMRVP